MYKCKVGTPFVFMKAFLILNPKDLYPAHGFQRSNGEDGSPCTFPLNEGKERKDFNQQCKIWANFT